MPGGLGADEDVKRGRLARRLVQYPQPKIDLARAALLAEQAGGLATDGRQRLMALQPHSLHQRTPCYLGSSAMVETLHRMLRESETPEPAADVNAVLV